MPKLNTYIENSQGKRISFTLDIGKRGKYVLCVQEGRLVVRVPLNFNKETVEKFIWDNVEWIENAIPRSAERSGLPVKYEDGERFRLLGEPYVIRLVRSDKYFSPKLENGELIISVNDNCDRDYIVRQTEKFISDIAFREVDESMARLTKLTGLYPNKVTLKSMTASWGRCSSKGNISINYKIVSHPKSAIDYVCIHELCHLRHMDHSKDFWDLVGTYCPDWKEIRNSLRG